MNNFDSNFSRKLMKSFLNEFENKRVLSKNVNTQLFQGKFNGDTGDTIDVKRPHDYRSVETADGDLSAETASPIISGKASATVQNYITVRVDYSEADEAIKLNQLDEVLKPAVTRIVTTLETNFAKFMLRNTALLSGVVGTPVTKWDHVALAGATMDSTGVPTDDGCCYAMNPYTQTKLASDQRSLGGENAKGDANKKATVTENFAGMDVKKANTLAKYTTDVTADRVGTLAANPVVTYLAAKDTMTQQLALSGFGANLKLVPGDVVEITGRYRLNLSTRDTVIDGDGNKVVWTGTVTQEATLDGTGAGTVIVTGPAIYEAEGAYNTVESAPLAGDVVTVLGAASTTFEPNLFWHKNAFTIASVPMKKLHATDSMGETQDGMQLRVTKFSDGVKNQQTIRFDLRPAFGALNPFFAGRSYGTV